MDSVKPPGLHGLLKDDRNSMGFYTFWFAVIFGTTSVILALACLLVSLLQNWAALHPQSVNGNRSAREAAFEVT
ncbi:hypothetical protein IFR04_003702 [Cadophora malorum]|uniref:Uncharacterized protein n=1 Tax=Cadophora malorum TaxID=108018 RepID=A0A8H8BTI8_9HELO|nr:hypothetical protein IFR04_003702 [Cadophora malorum]